MDDDDTYTAYIGVDDCQQYSDIYIEPDNPGKAEGGLKLFYNEIISTATLHKDVLDELVSGCILTVDDREEIIQSSIHSERNKLLLDILLSRPYDTSTTLASLLRDTDPHNADVIDLVNRMNKYGIQASTLSQSNRINSISVEKSAEQESVQDVSTKGHIKIQIQKNYKTIVHLTDCTSVVMDHLIAEGILSHEDAEEIGSLWNTTHEKNRKIIGKLLRKDDNACFTFLQGLRLDDQYIDIANQIETTIVQDSDKALLEIGFNALRDRLKKQCEVIDTVIPKNIQEQFTKRISQWEKDERKFVHTRATSHVMDSILKNSSVTVTGNSGSGKSFIVHHVALQMKNQGYFLVPIKKSDDIKRFYIPGRKMLFVIDDICGRFTLNLQYYNDWKLMLDEILALLDDKALKIIASCRIQVFRDDKFSVMSLFKMCVCNINSPEFRLTEGEAGKIARMYFGNKADEVCSVFGEYDFYPLLCQLYYQKDLNTLNNSTTNPFGILKDDLDNFLLEGDEGRMKYCGLLLCVLYYNTLIEDDFASIVDEPAVTMAMGECGLNKGTPGQSILQSLHTLQDVFISILNKKVKIIHDKLFDYLSHYFAKKLPCQFIRYAHQNFIRERFVCGYCPAEELFIMVPPDYETLYMDRLSTDWERGYVVNVFSNVNMKCSEFRTKFMVHFASLEQNSIIKLLQTYDVDNSSSPLLQVCSEGFDDLLTWVLSFDSDINCPRKDGACPLYVACEHGHINIVQQLMKNPQINVNKTNLNGSTPLMAAASFNRPFIVEELLKDSSTDINATDEDGRTALFCACLNGSTDVVKHLISHSVDLDISTDNFASPLYVACEFGHVDIVQEILKHSVDVNKKIRFGGSPLHAACYKNNIEIVKELLKNKNIDVNTSIGMLQTGKTPLYMACLKGYYEIVHALLEHPQIDVNRENVNGASPLYIAASRGHEEIVQALLKHKHTEVNKSNAMGSSPLYAACQEGHLEVVKCLLHKSADVNQATSGGTSPLSVACLHGHLLVIHELIINGADINQCSEIGETPFYQACKTGRVDVVAELIKRKADINIATAVGETPLFIACKNGCVAAIKELLLYDGIDYNACTLNGYSPLCIACQEGHFDIVKLLINQYPNIAKQPSTGLPPLFVACQYGQTKIAETLLVHSADINICNSSGKSPMYISCQNGHLKTVQLLLQYPCDVNKLSDDGSSPFYIACACGSTDVVFELMQYEFVDMRKANKQGESPLWAACSAGHCNIVKELLYGAAADANESNTDGKSCLYIASKNGHTEVVKELINYWGDINSCSQHGISPLHVACSYARSEIVEVLLRRHDICLDAVAENGDSPLHKACRRGHLDIVRQLLQHNININQSNVDGETPLFIACERKHSEIALELLKYPGIDVNKEDSFGISPLFLVLSFGMLPLVRGLLQHKPEVKLNRKWDLVDVEPVHTQELSPLHIACKIENVEVLEELLKYDGTDVNVCNDEGETPLFLCCRSGNLNVARMLLKYSADVNITNKHDVSPLHVACEYGREDIVSLLLQNNADVNLKHGGRTAKQIAKMKGYKQIVKMFKKKNRCLVIF